VSDIKVLLVRPKFVSIVAKLEPLGMEYVSGMLKGLDIPCDIHDEFHMSRFLRYKRLKERVISGGYSHVGFHVNANTVDYCLETAARLKKEIPHVKIMVGGPEAELNYKDFCQDNIDYIFYENGLISVERVFRSGFDHEVMKEATGIGYKDIHGRWILNEKGPPVCKYHVKPDRSHFYKTIKSNFIMGKGSFAVAKASFSCPYRCSFCYCTKMNSGLYTEMDLDLVIEDIKAINHQRIWFVDDDFLVNKERVLEFCKRVKENGIKKQFMIYGRADNVVKCKDALSTLYDAGVRDVLVGLEAINDDFLEDYNKETTKKVNEEAIKELRENKIVCNGLFVVSHNSTRQDFKDLIKFIKHNRLLWVVFGIFTPYKGSDAYEEYNQRLVKFRSKRLDGIHITIKPKHMTSFMFLLRFYMLYVKTYSKLYIRIFRKNAYDTKNNKWW
jgi:radical SAM superfamily enzyme YgiQ (UPF0313 family)